MKLAIVAFSLLLTTVQSEKPKINLELGDELSEELVSRPSGSCLTGTAQLDPCIQTQIDGMTVFLGHKERQRAITFILTLSEKFATSEGLRVGNIIEVRRPEVTIYPGWETRAPMTKDCWYPVIGFEGGIYFRRDGKLVVARISPDQSFVEAGIPTEGGVLKAVIGGFAKGVCSKHAD